MAYSSGFNPHPRISYAGASPTGAASEAEYLEIGLAERVEAEQSRRRPRRRAARRPRRARGRRGRARAASPTGSRSSRWRIDLPGRRPRRRSEPAVGAFLAATSVAVERMTKKGLRTFDSRAAVLALRASVVRRRDAARGRAAAHRPVGPARTTCWPGSARSGVSTCPGAPLVTRARAGSVRRRPRARSATRYPLDSARIGPSSCAILDVVDRAACRTDDPTTFSPVRSLARHVEPVVTGPRRGLAELVTADSPGWLGDRGR